MHHHNCSKTIPGTRVTTCLDWPSPKRFLECGAFRAKIKNILDKLG